MCVCIYVYIDIQYINYLISYQVFKMQYFIEHPFVIFVCIITNSQLTDYNRLQKLGTSYFYNIYFHNNLFIIIRININLKKLLLIIEILFIITIQMMTI